VKSVLSILIFVVFSVHVYGHSTVDSLLQTLDVAIKERKAYTEQKVGRILALKHELAAKTSLEERYFINDQLVTEFQTFKCDSALAYNDKGIALAKELNNPEFIHQSRLRSAFLLSVSGLFTQALEVFESIRFEKLPHNLKILYCWSAIRYNENLMKYTDKASYADQYVQDNKKWRAILLTLLTKDSDMYLKELAFTWYGEGKYQQSAELQEDLMLRAQPESHGYAMSAMGLATVYAKLNKSLLAEEYLIKAAITDVRSAVKENESLLTLAISLYEKGDVNRAYSYIQTSLEDANFYNSRFRNAVIARVQPIIEATYLSKIEEQRKNLKLYAIITSLISLVLVATLYFLYKQKQAVSRSRRALNIINDKLVLVNQRLDEANLVRERYMSYYMNQCAVYLDKLDSFRKLVLRKIKTGQLDELKQLGADSDPLAKDAQDLFQDFDRTFFEIYPNFIEEFNQLLKEEERYKLVHNQLNTELRIFALIRLGITDVNQIATFLRYSMQTIYNYKSKVKGKALVDPDNFEEKVKKIGSIALRSE